MISNNRFPRQRFRARKHKPKTTLRGGGNGGQRSERQQWRTKEWTLGFHEGQRNNLARRQQWQTEKWALGFQDFVKDGGRVSEGSIRVSWQFRERRLRVSQRSRKGRVSRQRGRELADRGKTLVSKEWDAPDFKNKINFQKIKRKLKIKKNDVGGKAKAGILFWRIIMAVKNAIF